MKMLRLIVCLLAAAGDPALATNPGFSFLSQPINLGEKADPSRIPLGEVPYYSNYDYGSTAVIHESRTPDHGRASKGDNPAEEQNLATACGISIEPFDGTQFPIFPAILRVKGGPLPASCPYTKEQVLIAVIHCILDYRGTKSRPIVLRIEPEDPKDAHLLRYEGHYVNAADDPKETVIPSRIPGSRLEVAPSGLRTVVFAPHLCARKSTAEAPQPGFIPVLLGEYDGSGPGCCLVAIWPGNGWREPVNRLTFLPSSLVYQVYGGNGRTFSKANSLVAGADFQTIAISGIKWADSPQSSMVGFDAEPLEEWRDWFADSLSVTCQALVLGTRPVPARPLKVSISIPNHAAELLRDFSTSPGWTSGTSEGRTWFRCTFTCDPKTAQPITGSIPGGSFKGLHFKSKRLEAGQ